MTRRQLELFSFEHAGAGPDGSRETVRLHPGDLEDQALVTALHQAGLATAPGLAAEIGRRRLGTAIAPLEKLCRRLVGFGAHRAVPEQVAALQALAAIGGHEARTAVARIITDRVVQGPTLQIALSAAARLGSLLPASRLMELLRDPDPLIREGVCRCVHSGAPGAAIAELLTELLDDLHEHVAVTAAYALGRIGRPEARPTLMRLLRDEPSAEAIEAVAAIADEDAIITLARVARMMPDLYDSVHDALERSNHPRAAAVASALQTAHRPASGAGNRSNPTARLDELA